MKPQEQITTGEIASPWPNFDEWREKQGMLDISVNSGEKAVAPLQDPVTGKFLPGNPGNGGRPKGAENYRTIFERALRRTARLNNLDPDSLYADIVAKGIQKARKGDFRFYKDILDRLHGKAKDHLDLTSLGDKINTGNQITFVNFRGDEPKRQ